MAGEQQGDVVLYQSVDDGEIIVEHGIVVMDGGLQTSVYISLFGGNEEDSGGDQDPHSWWGNIGQTRKYRSETQYLLSALAPSSANLKRVEDAVKRDLAWMVTDKIATDIRARVTIPKYNSVKITVNVDNDEYTYSDNWSARA